jgi:hypothetical protein
MALDESFRAINHALEAASRPGPPGLLDQTAKKIQLEQSTERAAIQIEQLRRIPRAVHCECHSDIVVGADRLRIVERDRQVPACKGGGQGREPGRVPRGDVELFLNWSRYIDGTIDPLKLSTEIRSGWRDWYSGD